MTIAGKVPLVRLDLASPRNRDRFQLPVANYQPIAKSSYWECLYTIDPLPGELYLSPTSLDGPAHAGSLGETVTAKTKFLERRRTFLCTLFENHAFSFAPKFSQVVCCLEHCVRCISSSSSSTVRSPSPKSGLKNAS